MPEVSAQPDAAFGTPIAIIVGRSIGDGQVFAGPAVGYSPPDNDPDRPTPHMIVPDITGNPAITDGYPDVEYSHDQGFANQQHNVSRTVGVQLNPSPRWDSPPPGPARPAMLRQSFTERAFDNLAEYDLTGEHTAYKSRIGQPSGDTTEPWVLPAPTVRMRPAPWDRDLHLGHAGSR